MGAVKTMLEPVPEDWTRALAVVAHPDDLEYGAASAVARWTAQGKEVSYVLVTAGEAGIDAIPPERCGPLRMEEERAGARLVGVETVEFLGFSDGLVEEGIPLRRAIADAMRRHRPEVVVTLNHHAMWPGAWNHADHRATGIAVLDSVRDAANRWMFTDLAADPWNGVRFVLVCGSAYVSHYVDVGATIELGVASLRAHRAYLDGLGPDAPDPDTMLRGFARSSLETTGCEYSATFELVHA